MKKFLENDRNLKLLSVLIAVMLWLYIIIILDPSFEVSVRDLPIQFIGEEQLHQNGLSVVNESETTISLKIRGSRKKLARTDMESIIAKVDISGINQEGTSTLPLEIVIPFENQGIVSQEHYSVDVTVEPTVSKQLSLEIKTEGSLAVDYMAGPMHTDAEAVTIWGPESVVGKIKNAGVVLNYGGADVDIDKELPIRLYDTNGKEILSSDAKLRRIQKEIERTTIHCKVVKLKTVVIKPLFEDQADQEILNTISYKLNPETVQIYGEEQVTTKVDILWTTPISLEKLTGNKKTKVKLSIPKGVKVLRDISEVEVTLAE